MPTIPFPKCLPVRKVNTDQHFQELDWINEPPTFISTILNTFFLLHKLKNYIVLEFGKYELFKSSR